MVKPRVLILRVSGTNCDFETEWAFNRAGAAAERVHINRLKTGGKSLKDYQVLVIPGGFSYGDDISAGKVLANQIRYNLWDSILRFMEQGKPVMGICNGFQVLVKAGLLPWRGRQEVTLAWNQSARFEDRWVYLRVEDSVSPFFRGMPEVVRMPVAHAEGRFTVVDGASYRRIEKEKLVLLRYCDSKGRPAAGYPLNPNGSMGDIAGICDKSGLVVGLMPHPERALMKYFYPGALREGFVDGYGFGYPIFKNIVGYFKG